ncbi:MAG TPA: lysylphosphatidylglycerol synthase transmembrane domain-containing protein [Candidatus Limnocylindrales bacterium]|nr:lysylphosphatidylglycerol synthase transmembrane domain-containing protein [Candidatus Limnocylindrales bacterium]
MTNQSPSFFKRRWKLILNILTIIALLGLVYAIRDQLAQTLRDLARVQLWVLLLMIPAQLLNYHSQTMVYQHLFRIVGNNLPYKFLYRTSLELNFINHVFPSGGVSGVSYFGVRMRSGEQISAAKATLVQVMKLALLILSFEILLVLGLVFLAVAGKANDFVIFVTGALSMGLVVSTVLFMYIIGTKRRINAFFIALTHLLNRIIRTIRPKHQEAINIEKAHKVFDDLHGNYLEFRKHYPELKRPFFWALMANATELATIYVVYIAFVELVNVGAVILAYAVANFAGLVSVLPGGVGVYEVLMTAVLAAGGVPAAISIPATVMYRVLSTLIQVPPGYYFYNKTLHEKRAPA